MTNRALKVLKSLAWALICKIWFQEGKNSSFLESSEQDYNTRISSANPTFFFFFLSKVNRITRQEFFHMLLHYPGIIQPEIVGSKKNNCSLQAPGKIQVLCSMTTTVPSLNALLVDILSLFYIFSTFKFVSWIWFSNMKKIYFEKRSIS